ncbi:MAG: hypothetical protein JSS66_14570 [Armatimonadetes bacterium]|nr:hypothetical protein [Armatimonadota bacterium]
MTPRQALVLFICFTGCRSFANLAYTWKELRGPFASANSAGLAVSLNDDGWIVGSADGTDGFLARIWRPDGSIVTLPNLAGQVECYGYGINSKGDVCGETWGPLGGRAAVWLGGTVTDIGYVPGYAGESVAEEINNHGVVVGDSWSSGGRYAAWAWSAGTLQQLPQLPNGNDDCSARGINSAGDITGHSRTAGKARATVWTAGQPFDILPPSGLPSEGFGEAVNDFQEVCGGAWFGVQGATWMPFVWRSGQIQQLQSFPGSDQFGVAKDISDCGVCVGYDDNGAGNVMEASLWERDGQIQNLMDLAGMPRFNGILGWSDTEAVGVNNKGQIVGSGTLTYAPGHARLAAVVWTPVSTLVPASSFTVVFGQKTSGNAASLAAADGDALRVCKFIVPNQSIDPVQVRMEGNLPWQPMNLWFRLRAKAATVGSYTVSLNLYDWTTSLYDPASNVTTSLTTSYTESETIAKGDISRYVRANDKRVWALVRVRPTGPVSSSAWCADFDQALWEAVPLP